MTNKKLFSEFPEVTQEQWIAQVIKDLKGESFDEKLTYRSADGIQIKPFYTAGDLEKYNERKPLFTHSDWEICSEIHVNDTAAANKKALHELNKGATALRFYVKHDVDVSVMLNEIGISYIATMFVVTGDAVLFRDKLAAYINTQGLDESKLQISISTDPVANLLHRGDWRRSEEEDRKELADVLSTYNTLCIDAALYHNAGASAAYEVACTLAHANTYLDWFGNRQQGLNIQLNVATGADYFFEIAKLRALRKTFALLLGEYGNNTPILIHAETATRNLTVFDSHNNLLRTTTAAMAASIGGCNSLTVKPFDITYSEGNEFSERLARNIQLILKSESYFDKVADVSAGSFFIEELTEQIAEKAWNYFTAIEAQGGLVEALKSGTVQQEIAAFALRQQQDFDAGKQVLVGTNKFPNLDENKQKEAAGVDYGTASEKGKLIETLSIVRLAAANEKERLSKTNA